MSSNFHIVFAGNKHLLHAHDSNAFISIVKQNFVFQKRKNKNQLIDNETQLLLTNCCNGKPNVIETLPFWLSSKEQGMWIRLTD